MTGFDQGQFVWSNLAIAALAGGIGLVVLGTAFGGEWGLVGFFGLSAVALFAINAVSKPTEESDQ